jgi:uncharacterized Tic20 family protein
MTAPPPGWQPPQPPQQPAQRPPHQQPYAQPYGPPAGPSPQGGPRPAQPMPQPMARPVTPEQRQRDDNTVSIFAYVGLIASFVVPLILYLIKKNDSPYVRHHSAQALNLALTSLVYTLLTGVVGAAAGLTDTIGVSALRFVPVVFLVLTYLLLAANAITYVVFLVVGAVKASGDRYYRIPGWRCWRMVK